MNLEKAVESITRAYGTDWSRVCRYDSTAFSRLNRIIFFFCFFLCVLPVQAKRIELVVWHAMAGHLGDEVRMLAHDFNQSQSDYFIKPVYKGNYVETLTSFAAAFRAHQPPAIVQIFEVGTAIMQVPKGVIKPIDELMHEQGMNLPKDDFIQSIREFYSAEGQLLALPFNLSVPTLYYNLDILALSILVSFKTIKKNISNILIFKKV